MFSGLGPSVSLGSAFLCDGLILEGRKSVDASHGGRGGLQCFRLVLWSAQQQREVFITVIVAPVLEGLSLAQLGHMATVARTGSSSTGLAWVMCSPVAPGS